MSQQPPGVEPVQEGDANEPQPHVLLRVPVDIRSVSLAVLAVLAGVVVLRWASAVLIPLMLGVMLSYALSPLVDWLQRCRVPRAVSAGVLLAAILGGAGAGVYSLTDDATALIERLPPAAQKLREAVRSRGGGPGPIEQVQKAATELEKATDGGKPPPADRGVTRVQVEPKRFDIKDYLWTGTIGLVSLVGQIVIVTFITFFLLASGDTFRRKLVKLAGPTLTQKRITVQALDEIDGQIQRYLLVQLATSALVGVATWASFAWIGLEQAAVWGVAAGVFNMIPYLGAIAVTGGSMLVGFLQFGTLDMALVVGLISLVINTLEGYLLTPWLTSRVGRMNPVAVFVGVLAWGWLWGGWGLILGVPILMVIKAISDRVDGLKPIGEILGR